MPAALVAEYKNAMLNIHPGLLPAFGGKGLYGLRVHQAVIASGARYAGATVHFVDEEYDTGPILAQAVVPVNPHETPQILAARVLEQVRLRHVDSMKSTRLASSALNSRKAPSTLAPVTSQILAG